MMQEAFSLGGYFDEDATSRADRGSSGNRRRPLVLTSVWEPGWGSS